MKRTRLNELTQAEILEALATAAVIGGNAHFQEQISELTARISWHGIKDMPDDFEGIVELSGPLWYRRIAFTWVSNERRLWSIENNDTSETPRCTHYRVPLPAPEASW